VVFMNGATVAEAGHAMYQMSDDRLVLATARC
jgi:hypothetical protein